MKRLWLKIPRKIRVFINITEDLVRPTIHSVYHLVLCENLYVLSLAGELCERLTFTNPHGQTDNFAILCLTHNFVQEYMGSI